MKGAKKEQAEIRRISARLIGGVSLHRFGPTSTQTIRPATGTVVMRWDGSRQPEIWNVPAPEMDPPAARLELARRYLHVFGPATPEPFARWAGIRPPGGIIAFEALGTSLAPVHTPIGQAWILKPG